MVDIAISGASGRMGQALIHAVLENPGFTLTAALDRPGSPLAGEDAAQCSGLSACGIRITETIADTPFDVLIDFTRPEASLGYLEQCAAHRRAMVIGTTGFTPQHKLILGGTAEQIPIVLAPNMSVGVNLLFKLLDTAATALGMDADVEIIEAHHRHKVDAPSGTAIGMGEVIAGATGRTLEADGVFTRHGHTGERRHGEIGFSVIRAGDLVGDHTALFALDGERIEIVHRASSRIIYANGALRAADWLSRQTTPGLYNMQNVLGFD